MPNRMELGQLVCLLAQVQPNLFPVFSLSYQLQKIKLDLNTVRINLEPLTVRVKTICDSSWHSFLFLVQRLISIKELIF